MAIELAPVLDHGSDLRECVLLVLPEAGVEVEAAVADPRRAVLEGAQVCLAKPFQNRALVDVCRRVLAAARETERGV